MGILSSYTDHAQDVGRAFVEAINESLASHGLELGISLEGGRLADEVAQKINGFEPLYDGDDLSLADDERTAWLLLYEGARLACEHKVALSLAG